MKKIGILLLIGMVCLSLTGCKKENKKEKWTVDMTKEEYSLEPDLVAIWNRAMKDHPEKKLKPIALLGKQVVAGMNYMFLCKDEDSYKVVVIYNNLEDQSSLTSVKDFDVTEYVNENKEHESDVMTGGWTTEVPDNLNVLDESIQDIWDHAMEKIVGVAYYPIIRVAHLDKSETNYAILCYGKLSTANEFTGIYLVTIQEDEKETAKLISTSYVDLAKFNK